MVLEAFLEQLERKKQKIDFEPEEMTISYGFNLASPERASSFDINRRRAWFGIGILHGMLDGAGFHPFGSSYDAVSTYGPIAAEATIGTGQTYFNTDRTPFLTQRTDIKAEKDGKTYDLTTERSLEDLVSREEQPFVHHGLAATDSAVGAGATVGFGYLGGYAAGALYSVGDAALDYVM